MAITTALQVKTISKKGNYSVTGCPGLVLRVTDTSKIFFFRYTFAGKRKWISLGNADFLTLLQARQKALSFLEMVKKGEDPQVVRETKKKEAEKAQEEELRLQQTFEIVALDWLKQRAENNYWKHNKKGEINTRSRLYNHIFPFIGRLSVNEIRAENIRDLILPLWSRSPSTSKKVLADTRAVFRYAMAKQIRTAQDNPASIDGALGVLLEPYNNLRKAPENHSGLDFREIPQFVAEISQLKSRSSELLLFSIFLAARSKAVRNAKWEDIDLEKKIWTVPIEDDKIKDAKRNRIIYLNDAAVHLLKNVFRFVGSPYVFCNSYGRPYSDMAMRQVIKKAHARKKLKDGIGWIDKDKTKRTGVESIITQHGTARSSFRTWAKDDVLGNNRKFYQEAVELNLLHENNDPYRGAYDRATLEKERRFIMEEWGKYCCSEIS